jgi:hypothetical protein
MQNSNNFILVSYYWGSEKFHNFAQRLIHQCKKLNINHHIACKKQFNDKYQSAINYKPEFILQMLNKFPKHNILYVDTDLLIKKYPILFEQTTSDFMCFNWNYDPQIIIDKKVDPYLVETSGGIFYFANNLYAKYLLNLWKTALSTDQYKHCADDRVLSLVIYKNKIVEKLRISYIPVEYLYIPQFFSHLKLNKKAVIIHDQNITSEEEAMVLNKSKKSSRIPSKYDLESKTNNYSNGYLLNIGDFNLNKRLKQFGFTFKTLYKLPSSEHICRTKDSVFFDINTVTADDILQLWKNHDSKCDVFIADKYSKIQCKSDIGVNKLKSQKLKINNQKLKIYLKYNQTNYNLIHNWSKNKNKSILGFINEFNTCTSYVTLNRISNI